MNNYCTNWGRKLEKDELVCKKCNTPIVDLPDNYVYVSPERKKLNKIILKLLIIIGICLLVIALIFFCLKVFNKHKVNNYQKKYVEPYLDKKYGNGNYSVNYDSSGKCIISGECERDYSFDCEYCEEYHYLDRSQCKAYYYNVASNDKNFIVTVVKKKYSVDVVEGKNIYGTDNSYDTIEDSYNDSSNNKYNDSSKNKNDYYSNIDEIDEFKENKVITVDSYPFVSDYYTFSSTNNQINLDNNGLVMRFFIDVLRNNEVLHFSGNILNPLHLRGNVDMTMYYYDKSYNEVGKCSENVKLLGEGYSHSSFSCHIKESELINGSSFSDIKYYKLNISSVEIDD